MKRCSHSYCFKSSFKNRIYFIICLALCRLWIALKHHLTLNEPRLIRQGPGNLAILSCKFNCVYFLSELQKSRFDLLDALVLFTFLLKQ